MRSLEKKCFSFLKFAAIGAAVKGAMEAAFPPTKPTAKIPGRKHGGPKN